jgi:hypothetical protein
VKNKILVIFALAASINLSSLAITAHPVLAKDVLSTEATVQRTWRAVLATVLLDQITVAHPLDQITAAHRVAVIMAVLVVAVTINWLFVQAQAQNKDWYALARN